MNRRNFFTSMIGGIAATAAVRTFPFRVFSFPKEIVLAPQYPALRFIRTFDPLQNAMASRLDVLYGFAAKDLSVPSAQEELIMPSVDAITRWNAKSYAQQIAYDLQKQYPKDDPLIVVSVLEN